MTVRFDRVAYLVVQRPNEPQRVFSGLRMSFQIQKYHDDVSNTGVITVYNLNPESRRYLARRRVNAQNPPYTTISLYAGYTGSIGLIFRGTLIRGISSKRGPDWVTELEGITMFEQVTLAKIPEENTWVNVSAWDVLVKMTGSDLNLHGAFGGMAPLEVEQKLKSTVYRNPVFAHDVAREVAKVLRDHGLTVDVDDVGLLISGPNSPVNPSELSVSPILSQDSGLINTPKITDFGVEVEHLLRHDVKVKHLFRVRSETTLAEDSQRRPLQPFTCLELKFDGDTHAENWFMEAKGAWFPSILDVRPEEPRAPLDLPALRFE